MEKCIYSYAWDFLGEGVDEALGRIADLGLNAVAMSVSYHAGKFILPRSPLGRVYFPEDGTVYFQPNRRLYDGELKPLSASILQGEDMLARLSQRCDQFGLKLHTWTVCMHNTRLGMLHPDVTVKNAFGDRYPYSLCPAQPAVYNYIVQLVDNLSSDYALHCILLESLGYMGFSHGYHHEFFAIEPNQCCQALLGLCFCDACSRRAQELDIDTESLAHFVREHADRAIQNDGATCSFAELTAENPALKRYIQMRCGVVTQLLEKLKTLASSRGILLDLFGPVFEESIKNAYTEGLDFNAFPKTIDRYVLPVASADIGRVENDITYIKQYIRPDRIKLSLNLGMQQTPDGECFLQKIDLIRKHDLAGCNIYNYSTLPQKRLSWLKEI